MTDYNAPNFLIADASRTPEEEFHYQRAKANVKSAIATSLMLLVLWGVSIYIALTSR